MKLVAICLLWCGYAMPVFGKCVSTYVSPFEGCMNDSAAMHAACTDSDYRCNEARITREYDCKRAEEGRSARDSQLKISERARDTIWANYPEMRDVIDLINEDETLRGTGRTMSEFIKYELYPNRGISNRNNIKITTRKVPREDMRTPQYWLLLKIWGDGYNLTFDGERSLDDSNAGVPTLPPNTGVWYFARGLRSRSPDNESDFLKAWYIGATGSPEGAEAIINGTFMDVPGVWQRVRGWSEEFNFAPFSDEGNHLLAYNINILREANFRGCELVELSLGMLDMFSQRFGDSLKV